MAVIHILAINRILVNTIMRIIAQSNWKHANR